MNIQKTIKLCIETAYASRSEHTARVYRRGISCFQELLLEENIEITDDVSKITPEHFIRFPAWLSMQGYAKKTVNAYLSGVKFLMDWLIINNDFELTYSQSLRYQMASKAARSKRETRMPRHPEKGQAKKVLDAVYDLEFETPIKERNIALMNFLYSSGCRNNEVASLVVKDINLDDRSARVIGKGSKERRVFISKATSEALAHYWKVRKFRAAKHPAFARHDRAVGKKKLPLTTASIRTVVDDCATLAGVDKLQFSPHYFRHAFAIRMLSETHDLALVQDLMGHADPKATRTYAKIYPEELQKAHRKVYK